jgi:hypothetical protein
MMADKEIAQDCDIITRKFLKRIHGDQYSICYEISSKPGVIFSLKCFDEKSLDIDTLSVWHDNLKWAKSFASSVFVSSLQEIREFEARETERMKKFNIIEI